MLVSCDEDTQDGAVQGTLNKEITEAAIEVPQNVSKIV